MPVQLLIFFSGASCEPSWLPQVFFLDDEDRFCTASTCDILPVVYNEYEHFKEAAILSFKGFGGGV